MAPAAALQPCSASAVTASRVSTDAFASACMHRSAACVLPCNGEQCSQACIPHASLLSYVYMHVAPTLPNYIDPQIATVSKLLAYYHGAAQCSLAARPQMHLPMSLCPSASALRTHS